MTNAQTSPNAGLGRTPHEPVHYRVSPGKTVKVDARAEWIDFQFDRCWPWIDGAIRKTRQPYGRDYVRDQIATGMAQLWPSTNAVLVTQVKTAPNADKYLLLWLAGGNRKEMDELALMAEAWGKRAGCSKARSELRPGFNREGKRPAGYRPVSVVMEKDL